MKFKIVKNLYKRYGFSGVIIKLVLKFFSYLGIQVDIYYCFCREITEKDRFKYDPDFVELSLSDFKKYGDPSWFTKMKLEQIEKLLEKRDENKCWGIIKGSELLCSGWVAFYYIEGFDWRMKLPSKLGYLWDSYTSIGHRGKGLHGKMIEKRIHELALKGYNRVCSFVSIYNKASYKGFLRKGFDKRQIFFVYRIWGSSWKTTLRSL